MPNILLTRIDNRLVHGQVGNSWVGKVGCNIIVVANDEAAADPIQQSLMKMTATSSGSAIRFWTLEKTIADIHKANDTQKIFIVAKTPHDVRVLVEGGVPIKEVCIGNMHVADGKRTYKEPHVYVDDNDIADFEAIKNAGVKIYIQIAPGNKVINID